MGVNGSLGVLRSGWRRFAEIRTKGRRRPCGRQSCSDRRGVCCSPRSRATQRCLPHPAGQLGRPRRPRRTSGRRPLSRAGMDRQGRTGRRRTPRQRRVPGCATGSRGSWGCAPASTSREGPEDRAFWIQAGPGTGNSANGMASPVGQRLAAQAPTGQQCTTPGRHSSDRRSRVSRTAICRSSTRVSSASESSSREDLNDQSSDRRRPPVGGPIHKG